MRRYEHVCRLGCLTDGLLFVAHGYSYAVVGVPFSGAFNSMGLTLVRREFRLLFFSALNARRSMFGCGDATRVVSMLICFGL